MESEGIHLYRYMTSEEATGVTEVEVAEGGEAEWYDLNGRRVAAPCKGIYILKQGTKVSKRAF